MSTSTAGKQTLGRADLLRWSARLAAKQPATLVMALVAPLLVVGIELIKPWPLKVLVDNGISGKPLSGTAEQIVEVLPGAGSQDGLIAWCAAATIVVFLLWWVAVTFAAVSAVALSQRMTYGLASEVYDHLQQMSPSERGRRRTGDLLRRVVGDTSSLATIVVAALIPALTAVLGLVATLLVMWRLNLPMTLLTLIVVPLLALTIWVFAERMERTGYQLGTSYGDLYTTVEERLSTVPTIQAFARESEADQAVWRAGDVMLAATLSATRAQVDFNNSRRFGSGDRDRRRAAGGRVAGYVGQCIGGNTAGIHFVRGGALCPAGCADVFVGSCLAGDRGCPTGT